MNEKTQSIRKATIGIAFLVLVSKGIGFLREIIIAYRFGTSIEYDVYLVAVSIPIALYSLFGYAFSNLFIPNYSRAVSSADKRSGLKAVWTDFNVSLLAAAAGVLIIIALAPHLIRLIAPGMNPRYLPEAVLVVRISSIVVVLAVMEAFFRSILNAEKHFLVPAAGPMIANLVIIASILALSGKISTRAILYGLICGYFFQVVVVGLSFRRADMIRFLHFRCFTRHTDKLFSTALIIITVAAALQLYGIIDRYFASAMNPGIISALGYSTLLVMLAVDILAYAFSTAVFPYLTDAFAARDKERSGYLLTRGIRISLLFALPMTMLFWVYSEKIIILLFNRGAFDEQSVIYTGSLLKYLSLSLTGQFLLMYLSRVYYAAHQQGLLTVCVLIAVAAKIILAKAAVGLFGYIGLTLSSSISYTMAAVILLAVAHWRISPIDVKAILGYFLKLCLSIAVGFLTAAVLYDSFVIGITGFGRLLAVLTIGIGITLMVFMLSGYLLRIEEIRQMAGTIRQRILNR